MNNRIDLRQTSLLLGMTTLIFIASIFVVSSLLFLVGVHITPFHLPLALLVTILFTWFAGRAYFPDHTPKAFAAVWIGFAAMFFLFLWISGQFYDLSYDGQTYHQEAIIHLKNGWNPVYDAPLKLGTGQDIWINHYAKMAEICAAALYTLTGHIELSKMFNLLLIGGSFFISLAALLYMNEAKKARAVAVALLLALNPVSIYQSFGFYVDGQLASLLLYLLALGYFVFKLSDRWTLTVFCAALILTVNNKFTAVGYAGVLCIGLLISLYMTEKFKLMKRMFVLGLASAVVGMFILGFNPYTTNVIRHGHPFYPLAGQGSKDVVESFTPKSFFAMNRVQSMVISNLSPTDYNSTTNAGPEPKIPFTVSSKELRPFSEPDVAIAGFGPLFGGSLLVTILVILLLMRINLTRALVLVGVLAVILVSVFINPAAWWARYVPQLWAVPLLGAFVGLGIDKMKWLKGVCWALIVILAVNVGLVAQSYVKSQYAWSQELKQQLVTLQQAKQPVAADFSYTWSNRVRFEEMGIAYKETKEGLPCADAKTLVRSGTQVCSASTPMASKK